MNNQIVKIDTPDISKIEKRLKHMHKSAPSVLSKAINRTITNIQKQMTDEVRKTYIVKAGEAKKTLTIKKSNKNTLSGKIISTTDKKIPLIGFKVSPAKPRQYKPPEIYKSKIKQITSMHGLTGSADRSKGFVARMPSGHIGVFQRKKGSDRQQIAELFGLPIPYMFGTKEVAKEIGEKGNEFLKKVIDQEINYLLSK